MHPKLWRGGSWLTLPLDGNITMYQVQWTDPRDKTDHVVRFDDYEKAEDYGWSIANTFTEIQVEIIDIFEGWWWAINFDIQQKR